MATRRIAGIAYLKADGRQIALHGSWTSNIIGKKREGIAGPDGVHGYKEEFTVPKFSGDGCYTRDTSIEEVFAIEDATITLELANGAVHMLRNAWCSDEIEVSTDDAKYKLTFEGLEGEELRAAN